MSLEAGHALIATGIAIAIAAAGLAHLRSRGKARRVVRGRPPLSASEFSALFETGAQAAWAPVVRDRLRRYIPVDPALVRPDDRLCDELQLAALDGLDANVFVAEVEKLAGIKIPAHDAQRILTLRDIVTYVARASDRRPPDTRPAD